MALNFFYDLDLLLKKRLALSLISDTSNSNHFTALKQTHVCHSCSLIFSNLQLQCHHSTLCTQHSTVNKPCFTNTMYVKYHDQPAVKSADTRLATEAAGLEVVRREAIFSTVLTLGNLVLVWLMLVPWFWWQILYKTGYRIKVTRARFGH